MTHITTPSDEIRLPPAGFGNFEPLLKFFTDGIREMNRYLDAASLVHSAPRQDPVTNREQSWEGPL